MAKRRDSAFFVYGQYCRYVRRLCRRAILPKCVPGDVEWTKLLQLCPDDLRQLSCRDFLNRLKLDVDLDAACLVKVKRFPADNASTSSLEGLAAKERENFGVEARGYIVSLLDALLENIHFTADIVHGMGCFDPHVLLSLLLERAGYLLLQRFVRYFPSPWLGGRGRQERLPRRVLRIYRSFSEQLWNSQECPQLNCRFPYSFAFVPEPFKTFRSLPAVLSLHHPSRAPCHQNP